MAILNGSINRVVSVITSINGVLLLPIIHNITFSPPRSTLQLRAFGFDRFVTSLTTEGAMQLLDRPLDPDRTAGHRCGAHVRCECEAMAEIGRPDRCRLKKGLEVSAKGGTH